MKITRMLWDAPGREGASTRTNTSYCRAGGIRVVQTMSYQSKSDRFDSVLVRFSEDNGGHWSVAREDAVTTVEGDTTIRNRVGYWLDPDMDRLIAMRVRIWLKDDAVMAGYRKRRYTVEVSPDGGKTFGTNMAVIESGDEYGPDNPVKGVWFGKNSYLHTAPLKLSHSDLLVPMQVNPVDELGERYNPLGQLTYTDLQFLHGRWDGRGERIEWRCNEPMRIDHNVSSRGLLEPTVARLTDGKTLLCLCRGSNSGLLDRPCYQWLTTSADDGWTWMPPRPLTWSDGVELHHPSAHSMLFRHSNGKLYWFGNALKEPAKGNAPRYPLIVAEFDESRLGPIRETASTIDTRGDGESKKLQLSNFQIYEDRETGDMVVTLCRVFAHGRRDTSTPATKYLLAPGK